MIQAGQHEAVRGAAAGEHDLSVRLDRHGLGIVVATEVDHALADAVEPGIEVPGAPLAIDVAQMSAVRATATAPKSLLICIG